MVHETLKGRFLPVTRWPVVTRPLVSPSFHNASQINIIIVIVIDSPLARYSQLVSLSTERGLSTVSGITVPSSRDPRGGQAGGRVQELSGYAAARLREDGGIGSG